MPLAVEVVAYRIVQEALTNVIKHSGASRTVVELEFRSDALVLSIYDNGRGAHAHAVGAPYWA